MKDTIYGNENGRALKVEADGRTLRVTIVELGNSPNDFKELAEVSIADWRVRNQLLPLAQSVAATTDGGSK